MLGLGLPLLQGAHPGLGVLRQSLLENGDSVLQRDPRLDRLLQGDLKSRRGGGNGARAPRRGRTGGYVLRSRLLEHRVRLAADLLGLLLPRHARGLLLHEGPLAQRSGRRNGGRSHRLPRRLRRPPQSGLDLGLVGLQVVRRRIQRRRHLLGQVDGGGRRSHEPGLAELRRQGPLLRRHDQGLDLRLGDGHRLRLRLGLGQLRHARLESAPLQGVSLAVQELVLREAFVLFGHIGLLALFGRLGGITRRVGSVGHLDRTLQVFERGNLPPPLNPGGGLDRLPGLRNTPLCLADKAGNHVPRLVGPNATVGGEDPCRHRLLQEVALDAPSLNKGHLEDGHEGRLIQVHQPVGRLHRHGSRLGGPGAGGGGLLFVVTSHVACPFSPH